MGSGEGKREREREREDKRAKIRSSSLGNGIASSCGVTTVGKRPRYNLIKPWKSYKLRESNESRMLLLDGGHSTDLTNVLYGPSLHAASQCVQIRGLPSS